MFLHHLVEMGGFELNHHWHGIDMLMVLECTLLAALLCFGLTLWGCFVRRSRRFAILSIVGALSFATAAYAANTALSALSASGAIAGGNLFYVVQTVGVGGVKATATQIATFINSLFSGDFTVASGGAATLKNTGPGATGPIGSATVAPIVTVDAQGRVTALSSASITQPAGANPTGTAGPAAVNGVATSYMRSDGAPAVQLGTAAQKGIVQVDGTTVTASAGVISAVQPAGANPTGTAGPAAVNGVATTYMRSDAAPAVQKASAAQFGIVEVDGTTITSAAGVISAVAGGTGTVTSVSAGCGTSTGGSPITTTGTVIASLTARTNTATLGVGADFVSTDCGGVVYDNSASSIAASLPVATTSGFGSGAYFERCNINAGVVTITPITSTIGGAATLVVPAGSAAHPSCVFFRSDGANYNLTEPPLGSGVAAATGNALSSAGGLTSTIASGTAVLGTSAIASGACATVVTVTATNTATTDRVKFSYNSDPTAVTGYGASATGAVLTIYPYPTANNVNVKVCNSSSGSITPAAMTLNWDVQR